MPADAPPPARDAPTGEGAPVAWHALSADEALRRLGSTREGISGAEAARRLAEHGPNALQAGRRVSAWAVLAAQLKNVLVLILLVAIGLSAAFGHTLEAVAILVIVLFAVLLGFVQEFRAERAMEALKRMAAPTATALRDGREAEVAARDLVPGDVVLLQAGDRVPADARLLWSANLQVEEGALTGESAPVEKRVEPVAADASVGDRRCVVHAGTAATYGRAVALVVATGMHTEFGRIARMLDDVESGPTPLQQNLDRVGHTLARIAGVVVVAIVALGLFRGQPLVELFIFGIALAVAVVPEALPAVVTISLALGVRRMVERHALVRRLPAVETLGSTSIIASDKTGTLTRDEMTVKRVAVDGATIDVTGVGYAPEGAFARNGVEEPPSPLVRRLLRVAALASDARVLREPDGRWDVHGDPTEGALVAAAEKAGMVKATLDAELPRVGEVPFTSESKRMTTLHAAPEGTIACVKGAPEVLLRACCRVATDEGDVPLDEAGRAAIADQTRALAAQAMRVLAVATRDAADVDNVDGDLVFLGLVGMIDPPRPEARGAVQRCIDAGIRVVMITGDHPATAEAVARELGILTDGRVVTGAWLDDADDATLVEAVEAIQVYARVSPTHKLRVVTALQSRGQVVAMTGDGVNDAPALKKADIGIAMGIAGTDVTREAAAMTLTDDNFASIVAAVEEGRGIFSNIKKYLMYLLSSNIGEIGLMAGASLLGMPLPLTAVQILYVNLATDGLPALALSVDPPERDLMRRRPRRPREGIFTRPVVALLVIGGTWSALVNLGVFAWALRSGRSTTEAMTMTFVSLVLIQFFKAYNFRSDVRSVFDRPFANRWLNAAIVWELGLLALIVHLPFLHAPFGTMALTPIDWAIVAGMAATISPVLEVAKAATRRGWFGPVES